VADARVFLAINSGSSSLKFALFARESAAPPRRGTIASDGGSGIDELLTTIAPQLAGRRLMGIGHRIVHGGRRYRDPMRVDDDLLQSLGALVPFAPNHLPAEIALIDACRTRLPEIPQIVCFDTAFHADLPDVARRLAIPREADEAGVRRYGFHGLSYTFLMRELGKDGLDRGRLVLAHLGSGSSLAAVRNGRCIDTSMGFTPIGGVVMSTRAGDLDPGVVTYLARTSGASAEQLERLLSHASGLAGISGGISDMRELLSRENEDDRCRLAVAIYCYAIRKQIGAYAAALEGIDALVFTGGIGEHAAPVRARICEGLEFLDLALDDRRNAASERVISTTGSRVAVRVIPTDEEAVIADAGYALLG
jgi:acetate kinase